VTVKDQHGSAVDVRVVVNGSEVSFFLHPGGDPVTGVFCIKAGPNQTGELTGETGNTTSIPNQGGQTPDVSYVVLYSVIIETPVPDAEWCSPGFWKANAENWGASAWPVPTNTKYNAVTTSPTASGNPTLLQVLRSPGSYFASKDRGAAFNAVGTYLSIAAGLNVVFDDDGNPIHNCTLSQN
jgi:hypothetical protein